MTMKLNTNSNVYTVVYATVLTVLVAILLTVAAVGLAPQQKANADNEKKQQVLSAVADVLGKEVTFTNAAQIWDELNMDQNSFVINTKGEKVEANAFDLVPKQQFKAGVVKEDATLPVYVAKINGNDYYIMCMYGAGLWDAIWGYIAISNDGSTIAGCSFDHAGETAGLGAKIKDDPNFAKAFVGKQVYVNDAYSPVVVSKKNVDNKVDAITGATKTSDCVSDMIANSLAGYKALLDALHMPGKMESCCPSDDAKCCGGDAACCAGDSCSNVEPVIETK